MASYFEDLNIATNDRRTASNNAQHNVNLDDFMMPAPRSTQHVNMDSTYNLQQMLQTANFLNQFREQMQAVGDHDHEQFLDNLVSQLLEESQSEAKGPPPAAERFIRMLPDIKADQLDSEETCIICKDNLKTSEQKVTKMPCGHLFDRDCLVPWLQLHNTCPLCRHEVETEQHVKEEEEEEARDMMYG